MKKLLIILLPLFFSPMIIHAQGMDFGLIGGINGAFFHDVPPVTDAVSSLGYMIGLRGTAGSNVFVEPAIEFVSYGSTITLADETRHEQRSNYIRFPLQVGLKLFGDAPVNVEVRGGLSGSVLVGYSDDVTNGPGGYFTRGDINPTRAGAILGGGVRLAFLKVDLEYEWGLTDFYSHNPGTRLNSLYFILGGNF
jgi:hypothetical protein